MSEENSLRRDLLKTGASLATGVGLAGCSSDNGETDSSEPTDNNEANGNGETTTPEADPEYSLETSLSYDLTDLEIDEPQTHDKEYLKENYSATPDVTLLENGSETTLEQLSELHLETEDGEEISPDERVPEYAVEEGETVYVTGETEDGETLETQTQVEKNLPREYVREVLVDGSKDPWHDWITNITGETPEEYSTPFRFDNQQFTFQEFYEIRREINNEYIDSSLNAQDAVETANQIDFEGLTKQEKIAEASKHTNNEMTGASAAAQAKAAAMEHILREHTDISEPIAAGGFDNPRADDAGQGNHGSQMIHADGDNYHSETRNHWPEDQARHVDNIEDTVMMSTAAQSQFVSVVGELSPEFEQVSSSNGLNRLNQMLRSFTSTDLNPNGTIHEKETGFTVRDKIVENQFEQALLGNMIGSHHAIQNQEQETHMIKTNNTILPTTTQNGRLSNQKVEKLK